MWKFNASGNQNFKSFSSFISLLKRAKGRLKKDIKYGWKWSWNTQSLEEAAQTPLHQAVLNNSAEKVLYFIQNGADVNVLDAYNRTPLYYAMHPIRLEIMCMLLYYEADVIITDNENNTPFVYAYEQHNMESFPNILVIQHTHCVVKVLFDYFDECFLKSPSGIKTVITAAAYCSPLAIDLIRMGKDLNFDFNFEQYTILYYALSYKSAELFKLLWPKVDCNSLIVKLTGLNYPPSYRGDPHFYLDDIPTPFLIHYLQEAHFPIDEWLECLYLLLDCPVSNDLIVNCINYRPLHRRPNEHYFIQELLESFYKNKVESRDRVNMIYTCLSLGAVVNYFEINSAFQMYGFGDELEALLYGVKSYEVIRKSSKHFLLLPMFILGCESDFDQQFVSQLYERELNLHSAKQRLGYFSWLPVSEFDKLQESNYLVNSLGYFALTESAKQNLTLQDREEVCSKLDKIPNVPSLTEICRNTFRGYVKSSCRFKYPYQFHEFIKNLAIPEQIKDVIRFKSPIY